MINKTKWRIALKLFALGALSICLIAFSRVNLRGAGGQAGKKVVERAFTRNEVVQFTEIKVSQNSVESGREFDADDDWLNKTRIRVKNLSSKPIVFLEVGFDFPETVSTGNEISYRVSLGRRPESRFPQSGNPIFMLPSDSFEIPLDQEYAKIKALVERRHRMSQINRLKLRVHFVIFADRTGWAAGDFYKQDPNDPDHYINIGEKPDQDK